jgi:hypothetical protein
MVKDGRGVEAFDFVKKKDEDACFKYLALIDIVKEVVKFGQPPEQIATLEKMVGDVKEDWVKRELCVKLNSLKIKIALIFEAITIAEKACEDSNSETHCALHAAAQKLDERGSFSSEAVEQKISQEIGLPLRDEPINSVATKLLVEIGRFNEAITMAEKISEPYKRWLYLTFKDITEKMTDRLSDRFRSAVFTFFELGTRNTTLYDKGYPQHGWTRPIQT